jgi:preprotein translocase subunit YajC
MIDHDFLSLALLLIQEPPTGDQAPPVATPAGDGTTAVQGAPAGAPQGAAPPKQNFLFNLLPILLIGVIFWFVLIRPERKARKAREALLKSVEKGDQVMTTSGLYGKVAQLTDDTVMLEVEDGSRLKFARSAVQTVIRDEAKSAAKSEK